MLKMLKMLKKFFLLILLLPVVPILQVSSAGDGNDKGSDAGNDIEGGTSSEDDDKDGDNSAGDTGKTFTQEQVNSMIDKRLARERSAWEKKLKEEKAKANMTEIEKLKAEKAETEKEAQAAIERANQRLIKSEVIVQATKLNIIDPDAAYALLDKELIKINDDGNISGVKEALNSLIKEKAYLVSGDKPPAKKSGDNQGDDKGSKGGFSMNDLIRKAAGR